MKEELKTAKTPNEIWQVLSKYYNTDIICNPTVKATLLQGITIFTTLIPKRK